MSNYSRNNKVTGVRWLRNSLENLKIKIKLKPQDQLISLPKFEDYTNKSNIKLEKSFEEYTFKWQEKIFSPWEVQRYADSRNCITDVEVNYNEMIKDLEYAPSKVFTYVDEDGYMLPPTHGFFNKNESCFKDLLYCMEKLDINDKFGQILGNEVTSSTSQLFKSQDAIDNVNEQWTAMHVVFDSSEYNEERHLLLKQEVTLLSLYHNRNKNYIIVTPNENNLYLNPYTLETASRTPLGYQYGIELVFDEEGDGDELLGLLRKLCNKWEKKHKQLANFRMPPLGKKQYYVSLEILTAADFDNDNLYLEYTVKLPEDIKCNDILHGRTHTSKSRCVDNDVEWHFGHLIELCLELAVGSEPTSPQLFLEVISRDWWDRQRTEGYTYLPITLKPGSFTKKLLCSRPEELDVVEGKSRRFFVGGCNLIKDLDVLKKQPTQDTNFRYVTSGSVDVRWNIISQANLPGVQPLPVRPGTSSASALLLGAEAALRKYKKARAKLAAATKDMDDIYRY